MRANGEKLTQGDAARSFARRMGKKSAYVFWITNSGLMWERHVFRSK